MSETIKYTVRLLYDMDHLLRPVIVKLIMFRQRTYWDDHAQAWAGQQIRMYGTCEESCGAKLCGESRHCCKAPTVCGQQEHRVMGVSSLIAR